MSVPNLIVVMGPTASGKSFAAEEIARHTHSTIINADAFQIYRGMDIGTAKPKDRHSYHLLDIRNPDEEFGVGEYVVLASSILKEQFERNAPVVITGGTGLYIRALLEEYKELMPSPPAELRESLSKMPLHEAVSRLTDLAPEQATKVDLQNEVRVKRALEKQLCQQAPIEFSVPPFKIIKLAIIPSVENSNTKIKQRTEEMFQNGWVAEVKTLLNNGYQIGNPGFRALGYGSIADYIQGQGNETDLIERIECETVKYAKRQRTWLRAEKDLTIYSEVSEALEAVLPQLLR
jgi:tRNA dimethylallyltransferase